MFSKALVISSLFSVAFATVYVTTPVASTTYKAGEVAVATWMDDNIAPLLPQFGLASIAIFVGNADQQTRLQVLTPSIDVSKTMSFNFTPNADIGPDGQEYFLRFQSLSLTDAKGQPVESFSALFTLTGMTGTFASSVQAEIAGQSTAPFAGQSAPVSGATSSTSTPSLTGSSASNTHTGTSSTTSATAKPSSGAMGLKAGWVGILFGAVVGVTMF